MGGAFIPEHDYHCWWHDRANAANRFTSFSRTRLPKISHPTPSSLVHECIQISTRNTISSVIILFGKPTRPPCRGRPSRLNIISFHPLRPGFNWIAFLRLFGFFVARFVTRRVYIKMLAGLFGCTYVKLLTKLLAEFIVNVLNILLYNNFNFLQR